MTYLMPADVEVRAHWAAAIVANPEKLAADLRNHYLSRQRLVQTLHSAL
jgi:hypothetical protein